MIKGYILTRFKYSAMTILIIGYSITIIGFTSIQVLAKGTDENKIYILDKETSLQQLALLSNISINELQRLNPQILDAHDQLNIGNTLLLPISSLVFSKEKTNGEVNGKHNSATVELPDMAISADKIPAPNNISEQQLADWGTSLAGQDLNTLNRDKAQSQTVQWAKAKIIAPIQQQAQDLLGRFGQAKLNLSVDNKGNLNRSTASLFTPWYNSEQHLLFSQINIHHQDNRKIGNFGLGHRIDLHDANWLLGYNFFIDHDFSRGHSRIGSGVEARADYLKFSANYYHPLSQWQDSPDFDDYLERPAKGFDLRTQGYVPAYPQWGASAVYEQYFGDEVALFGKSQRQKDPHALTLGIDYTPIPLVTLGAKHKYGQQGKKDTQIDVAFRYQFGSPLSDQLNPDNVSQLRTLKGSRYDLVDRNNDIILEYKEKQVLFADLAAVPDGLMEGDSYILRPLVRSKYPIIAVNWLGDVLPLQLLATAGNNNPQGWQITLPTWSSAAGASNRYQLSLNLQDQKNHRVTTNTIEIQVGQRRLGRLLVEGSSSVSASGQDFDAIRLVSYLEDHNGVAINDHNTKPEWLVHSITRAPVALVNASQCPLNAAGQIEACLRIKDDRIEVRDGVNYHVLELVSTLAGNFTISSNMGSYGLSNSQVFNFSSTISTIENLTGGIFLATDSPTAGSGALDYAATGTPLKVGETYRFVAWSDNQRDGIWSDGDEEVTSRLQNIQWYLDGNNGAASGGTAAITLVDHVIIGATTDHYTVPVNSISSSGQTSGDQGFRLKVGFN